MLTQVSHKPARKLQIARILSLQIIEIRFDQTHFTVNIARNYSKPPKLRKNIILKTLDRKSPLRIEHSLQQKYEQPSNPDFTKNMSENNHQYLKNDDYCN